MIFKNKYFVYFKNILKQKRLRDLNENRKNDVLRVLHRIDSLTLQLNRMGLDGFQVNVFTFKQRSEISLLISSMESEINTYSQYGEDLVIYDIFKKIGIIEPTYIDVGAHHPKYLSNTALLNELGSVGINIEANPVLIQDFLLMRKNDVNLNVGVGVREGKLKFNLIKDSPALSTFDDSQVEKLLRMGKSVEKVIEVDVYRLTTIIEKYFDGNFPDFLSIDVEGSDFEILNTIDFEKSKPKVICVEINEHDTLSRIIGIDFLLFKNGYFHYGDVGGGEEGRNAIFVDIDFLSYF